MTKNKGMCSVMCCIGEHGFCGESHSQSSHSSCNCGCHWDLARRVEEPTALTDFVYEYLMATRQGVSALTSTYGSLDMMIFALFEYAQSAPRISSAQAKELAAAVRHLVKKFEAESYWSRNEAMLALASTLEDIGVAVPYYQKYLSDSRKFSS